jgi:hypothetical protein
MEKSNPSMGMLRIQGYPFTPLPPFTPQYPPTPSPTLPPCPSTPVTPEDSLCESS